MVPARDRRTGFSRRRQYGVFAGYVLAVAGAVVGAALLGLSALDPPAFAALRMAAAGVTAPVSAALASAVSAAATVPAAVGDYLDAGSQNARMRRELTEARRLLNRARAINYDNARLRALLRLRDREGAPVASARLVSSTPSSTRRFAVLNAGRWQGVRPGMPVRGPDGLVGRVVEAGPNAARVLLLTDPDSIVPVRRTRDGLPAIVVGRGDGTVDIRSANAGEARFRPGDLFVTSGAGGIYPPDLPVARTVAGGHDSVVAAPFARADTLDFALVYPPFFPVPAAPPATAPQAPSPVASPPPSPVGAPSPAFSPATR